MLSESSVFDKIEVHIDPDQNQNVAWYIRVVNSSSITNRTVHTFYPGGYASPNPSPSYDSSDTSFQEADRRIEGETADVIYNVSGARYAAADVPSWLQPLVDRMDPFLRQRQSLYGADDVGPHTTLTGPHQEASGNINVASDAGMAVGDILYIGSEQLRITALPGTSSGEFGGKRVDVTRGVNGTTAATAAAGARVRGIVNKDAVRFVILTNRNDGVPHLTQVLPYRVKNRGL